MRTLGSLGAIGMLANAAPAAAEHVSEWLARKQRAFELYPEYQDLPGHGWKPYHRLKWFYEQRLVNGEEPEVGARWLVWEEKIRREQAAPSARATWFSVGPSNLAGRILALAFDPTDTDILYAGSASGGLWKSTSGGTSWMPLTDELPTLAVGGVAVSPLNPNVVVIGTGEGTLNIDRVGGVGVLKSTDAGATWSTTGLGYAVSSGHGFHVIRANPVSGTLLAGATDGLYRSTDEGDTWDVVRNGGNYYDVQWKPGDANRVYACKGNDAAGNNVKVSTDDGVTWAAAGTGQPASSLVGKTKIAVTPADPTVIYAIYAESAGSSGLLGVYRSTDDGGTWTLRATSPNIPNGQGWYNLSLAADPNDAGRLIAGGVALYRSTDGGGMFAGIGGSVHVDHHDAVYRPGGTGDNLFVATDGGIWESTNDGSTWLARNTGLVTYQFYDICVNNNSADPNFLMGGTQDQGTDRWSGTPTWSEGLGGDGMVCNINPVNGTTVFAETQFGIHYRNITAGVGGWTPIMDGITGTGDWVTPVGQDQQAGGHLYTETDDGIFRSVNGMSWTNVSSHRARWISISPIDGRVVWTVRAGAHRSTDDGASWQAASAFPFSTGTATKILAHPTNVDAAFVTFSGYAAAAAHVALTTDLGLTWTDVTGDLPSQPVNAIAIDKNHPTVWFIGTDVGVWYTANGGLNWLPYETGLPNAVVADLEIQNATQKLFAGTHGRGVWEVDFSDVTSLDPEDDGAVMVEPPTARDAMFDPVWPNPVRDEATFRFAARAPGGITIDVYDVRGRRVSEAVRAPVGDGIIRLHTWYSTDVPSGVYFAVLRAGGEQITRKFLVTH